MIHGTHLRQQLRNALKLLHGILIGEVRPLHWQEQSWNRSMSLNEFILKNAATQARPRDCDGVAVPSLWNKEQAKRSFRLHQVTYEAVVSPIQVKVAWAESISFYTIVASYNGLLAAAQAHIHVITHINMMKGGAISTLNSPSSGHIWGCSIATTIEGCMSCIHYLLYYRCQL